MKKKSTIIIGIFSFIVLFYFLLNYVNKINLIKRAKETRAIVFGVETNVDASGFIYKFILRDEEYFGGTGNYSKSKESLGDSLLIIYDSINPNNSIPKIDVTNILVYP